MTDDPRFEELGDVEHLAHDDDEAEEDVWEPVQLEPAWLRATARTRSLRSSWLS
jgi:hypothetical protein